MKLPTMPSFSLKGRTALVVGASSGIGTACAVALAEYGAKVTVAARRKEKLEIFSKTSEHNFYHINDVIESVTKLIIDSQTNDKIFNLQTPNGISVESMVNTAIKIADSKIEITWKDENHRDTQVEYQEKNANDHIISPITSLEDGLSETFVWYKKNISLYNQFGV